MEKKALSPSSPTSSSSPSSLASSAFSRGDYKNAADLLLTSDSELDTEQTVCAALSLLLLDRLYEAKALLLRGGSRRSEVLSQLGQATVLLLKKDFEAFFVTVGMIKLAGQTATALQSLVEQTRAKAEKAVSVAYKNIMLGKLALLLGLSKENTLKLCGARGWSVEKEIVQPVLAVDQAVLEDGEKQLLKLAQCASRIETI